MSTILDKIVAYKRNEISQRKAAAPVKVLERSPLFNRSCFSLETSVKDPNKTGIIAEFKRKSPSKDVINDSVSVEEVTKAYTENGASGLSVLTDMHFFGGSSEDLQKARNTNTAPILRKDFIIDEYQIIEAKSIGADVILLITECLSASEIKSFTQTAKNLGMEVLLEMHSEKQLEKVGEGNTLVGINNRDLKTFKVDIDRSIELSHKLPENTVKIAESGISNPEVVLKMRKAGFDGFLMGEHFMKAPHPGKAFRKFAEQLSS